MIINESLKKVSASHSADISENNLVFTDIVRSHTQVDIFDLYHDEGKAVNKIWVLGGRLNPRLAEPELVFRD